MPPPGASAPAFAATAEAARCKSVQERVVERVLRNGLHPASILDFRPRLANQCKDFLVYPLFRASILDFRPKLGNQCKLFPVYTLFRASILDFRAKLANRCSTIVMAVENGPPAASVATTIFRVRFYSSLPRKKMARLQQRQQYGALPCRQL